MSIEALEKKLDFARNNADIFDPITVLDKGFVRLVDWLGDDSRIVQAARVSYGDGTKTVREDAGLIDYLMRHQHTSPFEKVVFTFHLKLPLFVFAQLVRHRTASLNAQSARYSVMKDEFFLPRFVRAQSTTNKQGSDGVVIDQDEARDLINIISEEGYASYEELLEKGVARELARVVLPQNLYTEVYWTQNLHNLFHLLKLRLDEHAQFEIQVYAAAIFDLVERIVPASVNSWANHVLHSVSLSSDEVNILNMRLSSGKPVSELVDDLVSTGSLSKGRGREIVMKLERF